MNLRFIERDGKKILQQAKKPVGSVEENNPDFWTWSDVPLVQEPRKPREWNLYSFEDSIRAILPDTVIINYSGTKAPQLICKVREIIE